MKLLVIDIQELIMDDSLYNFTVFKHNVKKIIETSKEHGVEVIYVRHDDGEQGPLTKGSEGFEIEEEFKPNKNELIFDKVVNSPFHNKELLTYLKNKKETCLMVVGLQSDYCIDATIKCGFEHNFKMIVPANSNTTCDNEYMSAQDTYTYYNEFIWPKRYAECISFEEAIRMIQSHESNRKES